MIDLPERPAVGHVRLGVRADPHRSNESGDDLHPGRAAQPIDGRRQDVRSFAQGVHSDHHGLWIDPANTNIIYNSNDGGFYQTADGGKTWKFAVAAGGSQFYNVELDTSSPPWAYGSIQDIGSRRGRDRPQQGPRRGAGRRVGERARRRGLEPRRRSHQSEHRLFARLLRQLQPDGSRRAAPGGGRRPRRSATTDSAGRSHRRAARAVDGAVHHLAARQHHRLCGLSVLFKSTNRGDKWEKISRDLTDNNAAQMGQNPSAIPYQTIIAMAESPKKKDLLYVGTDDGRLHTTIDGGKEWTELTIEAAGAPMDFARRRRRRTPKARCT